jgi:hypothetical protein
LLLSDSRQFQQIQLVLRESAHLVNGLVQRPVVDSGDVLSLDNLVIQCLHRNLNGQSLLLSLNLLFSQLGTLELELLLLSDQSRLLHL